MRVFRRGTPSTASLRVVQGLLQRGWGCVFQLPGLSASLDAVNPYHSSGRRGKLLGGRAKGLAKALSTPASSTVVLSRSWTFSPAVQPCRWEGLLLPLAQVLTISLLFPHAKH